MYDMEGCSSRMAEPQKGNNKDSGDHNLANETVSNECDSVNINHCATTNHCRKTSKYNAEEKTLIYTWKQTEFSVDISIKLEVSTECLKNFDVTFTTRTANILLSDEESHVIHLHDLIIKEKSKVEIKKGNAILRIVKKKQGLWPCLEMRTVQNGKGQDSSMIKTDNIDRDEEKENGSRKEELCKTKEIAADLIGDGDSDKNNTAEEEKGQESQPEIDNKEEKPVYHLEHLKHDFFERGALLTLQVFCKCLGKDSVEISFHNHGFVLKFQTSDTRFLNLHAGTSSDTTFSWTVTTRGEIKPDVCSFKVKQAVVEVSLHKTSSGRWASLEAPIRKDNESSKSNTWLPLTATSGNAVQVAPSSSSSLPSSSSAVPKTNSTLISDESNKTSVITNKASVMFDEDLSDVNLREKKSKGVSYIDQVKTSSNASVSALSETIKFRSTAPLDSNKPTAKVQPLTKDIEDSAIVISQGYSGLVNLGNTCFMNCVLQVLANTREFRDYFLDGRFQHEINEENPLGMKGHLAATFGILLHWLWSGMRHCWEPRKLKDLISKKNPQFFGFAQHDAHEFLAFLLDGLHEDLNRIKKKPYTETVDSNGRPDEVVASEAWTQYKQRNDSVVVDMFQGQYKSTLVCPRCGRVSITFDPFLYLSVPLPKKKKIIPVTFMWKEYYKKPHLFHIQVLQDSTVEHLIEILHQKTSVPKTEIRVFEAYKGKIHKFFFAGSSLSNVDAKDIIIACEVLPREIAGDEVLEIPVIQRTLSPTELPFRCAFCHKLCMEGIPLKRCSKCFKVGYCDQTCQRNHWNVHKPQCNTSPEPIGCPFILSIPASRATYGYLVKLMEGFARFSVNIFQPPVKTTEGVANSSVSSTSVSMASTSNLSSSLSQSCSSLNSLDSLSSASSTCTLTGDQSDPQIQEDGQEEAASTSVHDPEALNAVGAAAMPLSESSGDVGETASRTSTADSGIDVGSVKSERHIPTSQVMGVQAVDVDRDKATATFFIKPVTMEGVGVKGAERLEDKGDTPLDLSSHKFLSMDWRNNGRQQSCVLVQSKDMEAKEVDDSNNTNSDSNKPTLYQCLELFTEPEILRPEEAWYCPTCKQHVEASKQMAIWKLPHTLIIQLKRFSFQNFLLRSKIKKHIDFPIRGLDLQRFCAGASSRDTSPLIYDLYGVANHHGLLIGGHYTSFARCAASGMGGTDEVGWRLCDDSRVTQVANEKSVVTSDAYLLFYRRRGKPADINCSVRVPPQTSNLSSRIIPKEIDLGDDLEPNDFDGSNSGSLEEVDFNEAVTLSSSSPIKVNDSSHTKTTTHIIDETEVSVSHGEKSKLNQNSAIVSQDVCLAKANVNSDGEEEFSSEEEVDLKEKGDEEKEFQNCVKNNDYYYSDDDEDKERSLVIDTSPDLGYTDMEAVD